MCCLFWGRLRPVDRHIRATPLNVGTYLTPDQPVSLTVWEDAHLETERQTGQRDRRVRETDGSERQMGQRDRRVRERRVRETDGSERDGLMRQTGQ